VGEVEERVMVEELYEYRGSLGNRRVNVKAEFKEGVLWDISVSSITEEMVEEAGISCTGYSELMDRCFEVALDIAQRLIAESTPEGEAHHYYVKISRGEL
jgi:hypothetical protein